MKTEGRSLQTEVIEATKSFVKKVLGNAEGGHDYWHAIRVLNMASEICNEEGGNMFVVQLSALLHDIADSKFHNGNEEKGPEIANNFLQKQSVNVSDINHVINIIRHISFSKSFEKSTFKSHELDIVRDADMLDAIGAIGIARTFNYGGHKGNAIYSPHIPPRKHMSKDEYKNGKSTTINHFYEKLLLLKDRMKTEKGREMAIGRHRFMEEYLNRFYKEWEGEK